MCQHDVHFAAATARDYLTNHTFPSACLQMQQIAQMPHYQSAQFD
jgi:hypothetical protein